MATYKQTIIGVLCSLSGVIRLCSAVTQGLNCSGCSCLSQSGGYYQVSITFESTA